MSKLSAVRVINRILSPLTAVATFFLVRAYGPEHVMITVGLVCFLIGLGLGELHHLHTVNQHVKKWDELAGEFERLNKKAQYLDSLADRIRADKGDTPPHDYRVSH